MFAEQENDAPFLRWRQLAGFNKGLNYQHNREALEKYRKF